MTINSSDTLLLEIAWEVCNQVGGIYTVIRSKVPAVKKKWGDSYFLIGPYFPAHASSEFEPIEYDDTPIYHAAMQLRDKGFEVHYGTWLVSGKPKVLLFNPLSVYEALNAIKHQVWEDLGISIPGNDPLIDKVVAFSYMVKEFFSCLANGQVTKKQIIAHFHEWMAALPIPIIRKNNLPVKTVFLTHATMLGRYLAMNDPAFYHNLPKYNWETAAAKFGISAQVNIERAAAHTANVFTTVSDVTAQECVHLLGKKPDLVLPNGLNIDRFEALHEFQNLHLEYKNKIHQFIMGHFFHSYKFDLDNTLYFFTSGRYEFRNKGFDITLEALKRLNGLMRLYKVDTTVVMFFVTRRPYHTINPTVLQTRAELEELRKTCDAITKQIGEKLFYEVVAGSEAKLPPMNEWIDEYWKLRLRRSLKSWHSNHLPIVVTHNLKDDVNDEILQHLRAAELLNYEHDKVKIIYHPEFITASSPLFGMDYVEFVRGCHLGVFPSYYEPWGYTPLECIASGIPTVTSDLAGFGNYVEHHIDEPQENGIYVVNRFNKSQEEIVNQLTEQLFSFVQLSRRQRIQLRNRAERASVGFDWQTLSDFYDRAYAMALAGN